MVPRGNRLGLVLVVIAGTGDLTVSQSGTTPSFTNIGTLTTNAGTSVTVNNGTFTQQAGATLNGGGAFAMNVSCESLFLTNVRSAFTFSISL